jgi:hypothetical protein
VGRAAFKKGSIPWAVAIPSYSPHASRPSTFRAPGWGAPALPSSCCRWRSTTSRGLAPFSHRSASRIFIMQPGCIPSPMVIQDDDHHFDGGEKQAGLRPLPRPQLQGSSLSLLGRRAGQVGACLRLSRGALLPSVIGGEGRSPSVELAAAACLAHRSEWLWRCFRCHLPLLGRSAAARPPHECWLRRVRAGHVQVLPAPSAAQHVYAARAVIVFWDGPVLVLVARTGVRTCRCALGRPSLAGAALVGRWLPSSVLRWWQPEKVSPPTRPSAPPAVGPPALRP